ncbi:unnamed protein product [Lactuca saligna]|uniref:SWIM-type domain-containing protein n=1 Tax=Lactuca saligna TaxID=75948 RepID=A0AA35ZB53_LACSI|nr:unnamed protein product [Lactuca saligna]
METVHDFDTIDVKLDEFFKHKQRSRCKDEFLNTLTDEALDECTIPEINLNDFEGMSEDEAPQDKQSDSEGDDEDKLQFQYSTMIRRSYPIRFKKCDSVRLVAVCASDREKFQCPFVVRDSWMSTERSFQIKKMVEKHTCVRNFRSANLMDPTWIARQFLKEMIRKPNLKSKEMQAIIQSRFHCKGLLEAVKVVLPRVEHRQCARHVYANFRKVFSGIEFKNMFWIIARSTVEGDFKLNMEKIKEVNPAAYDHLMARETKSWCMEFFKGGMACEAVENGMAECFNAIILDARKKPLLAMLEEIRLYMMERLFNLKQEARKWVNNVCPGAIKKMDEFAFDIKTWFVHPSGLNAFEVRNGFHSYGVNLEGMYCTCRLWELSAIPCVHAQATIIYT